MLIHSGTNDLTLTTPVDNFISDFSFWLHKHPQCSRKVKKKISTLLPRVEMLFPYKLCQKNNKTLKLIDSFSFLPNLHLVTHENIFSKETDILHDTKQLKKRHFGLLAANLVAAVRGWANAKTLRSSPNPVHRSPPSTSRSLYTTPIEVPGFLSHTVKNSQTRAYPTPRTQQLSPLCSSYDSPSEGYFSYSDAVKNGHTSRDPLPSNV